MTKVKQDELINWQKLVAAAKPLLLGFLVIFIGAFGASYIPMPVAGTAGLSLASRAFLAIYNTFLFSGGMFLTSQYSSKPINSFTNALSPYLDDIYLDPETEKYKNLLARYENMQPYLDHNNTQVLDFYFLMYHTWLYDISNKDWRNFVLKNISQYLEYTFTILEQPKPKDLPEINKSDIDAKAQQLLDLLETYPDQAGAIVEIVKCIAFYQLRGQEYKNIRAICLEGPPGVGKTTILQKICDIYNINIVILKGNATIGQQANPRQFYEDFVPSKSHPIVQTLYASRNFGYEGYTLMFYDEIDKLPNNPEAASSSNLPTLQEVAQSLLEITDNDQLTIKDPYTALNYCKDRVIVAMATNNSILKLIPGLESRVDVIKFDKIDQETKLTIAMFKLEMFCADNDVECDEMLRGVVTVMVANNHEDGVRELVEDIRSLVYAISQNEFYQGTLLEKPKVEIFSHYKNIIRDKAILAAVNDAVIVDGAAEELLKPTVAP